MCGRMQVEPTVNVKQTFGEHAFLVDRRSRTLVELAADGAPRAPLCR